MTPRIDEHLAAIRSQISVVPPCVARSLRDRGALFVDTRPEAQRRAAGEIPGALTIERNVLEWRLAPTSAHPDPVAAAHSGPIVVFCQEGYASSLAVASLQGLGVPDVHDLGGGFEAWAAAGLPVHHP